MSTVRIGVVGAGVVGADRVNTLHRRVSGADVVSVADVDEGRAGSGLVSLAFVRRFDAGYVDLKAAVASGTHGAPFVLHCVSRGVTSAPGCTDEFSVTGSAIHEFDTVPRLLDSPLDGDRAA